MIQSLLIRAETDPMVTDLYHFNFCRFNQCRLAIRWMYEMIYMDITRSLTATKSQTALWQNRFKC